MFGWELCCSFKRTSISTTEGKNTPRFLINKMVCVYFFKSLVYSYLNLDLSMEDWRPIICVFCEYYLSKSDALRREQYFKTTAGKRVLRLMLQDSLMLVEAVK